MSSNQLQNMRSASYVIEHEVAAHKQEAFRNWQNEITKAASQSAGYQGTDVCPPVEEDEKWYIVVHFDSPEHLNQWLNSDVRREFVKTGKDIFSTTKITYYKTGLERWFINQKTNPPAWKQIMATLLGLYPTVMILLLVQSALSFMQSLPRADAMLISNFASVCLLTWFVMPSVSRSLKFWLHPPSPTIHNDWIGLALIVIALGMMRSIFAFVA
ncbi:MAG: antibiotic biosynthesis monooxygenase [Leptolyngbyaceae cyanobacterium bins.302]|nr:antibiotic biosynthesis monooxygenase [Leptolyngbyaceae cyanobacterium bins.302]